MAVFQLSLSLSSVVPDPCIEKILNRYLWIRIRLRNFLPDPEKIIPDPGSPDRYHSGFGTKPTIKFTTVFLNQKHNYNKKIFFLRENFP